MKIIGEHGACVFLYVNVMHSVYVIQKNKTMFSMENNNYYKLLGTKYYILVSSQCIL